MSKQNVIEFDAELWAEWCVSISAAEKINLVEDHGVKKLSLLKWHPDNAQRGEGRCPMCFKYLLKKSGCCTCPLFPKVCVNSNSPIRSYYWRWVFHKKEGHTEGITKYANLMFKAISEIEEA